MTLQRMHPVMVVIDKWIEGGGGGGSKKEGKNTSKFWALTSIFKFGLRVYSTQRLQRKKG